MSNEKKIVTIDSESPNFEKELDFNLWSTQSSTDYSNDREREYNGLDNTETGIRGKTVIKDLTIRDVCDCMVKAFLDCAPSITQTSVDEFNKCFSFENNETHLTQYLIDRQNEPDYIHHKVELGTWRYQDVYKIKLNEVDPLAVVKATMCYIEKMMNIFPNI